MNRILTVAAVAAIVAAAPAQADQATALAAIRQQPKVIDVSADTSGNVYVLVKAENIAWPQYASYLCKVAAPHEARIFRVRIVELTKAIRTQPAAKWDRLGEAACS